jgi:predicted Zn-dependent protease
VRLQEQLSNTAPEHILAVILGMAAALAGRPDVGAAVMSGGQNVILRNILQYSRTQESAADSAAMLYLDRTQQSARGLLSFMQTLAGQELLTSKLQDPYLRTHPLSQDRIEALSAFVAKSPYSDTPIPPETQRRHQRMLAKLQAFLEPPAATLQRYPGSDSSETAQYARAIAAHRAADLPAALKQIDGLIAAHPDDPYYHELKGQVLFESGRPKEALAPYETAVRLRPEAPLLRLDLARVQMATDDPALLKPAINNLRVSLAREPKRPFVWRQLAIALGRDGQEAQSALALAEEAILLNKPAEARYHAGKAERLLPTGSPGWLQAKDIIAAVDNQRSQ